MVSRGTRCRKRKKKGPKAREDEPQRETPTSDSSAAERWLPRLRHLAALVLIALLVSRLHDQCLGLNAQKWRQWGPTKDLAKYPAFDNAPDAVKLMYTPDSFIYYRSMLSIRGDADFEHRYRFLRIGFPVLATALSRLLPIPHTDAIPLLNYVALAAIFVFTYLLSQSLLVPILLYLWGNLWVEWGFMALTDTPGTLFLVLALLLRFQGRTLVALLTFALGLPVRDFIIFVLPLLLTGGRLDKRSMTIVAVGIAGFLIIEAPLIGEISQRMMTTLSERYEALGTTFDQVRLAFMIAFGRNAYKLVFLITGYVLAERYILPEEMVDPERHLLDLHLAAVLPLNLVMFFLFTEDFTARYLIYSVPAIAILSASVLWSVGGLVANALKQEAADEGMRPRSKGSVQVKKR